ncbi:MAG TPA: phage holin family protein [Flavobacteriales bacterium]|nr:phage holin family protein [Flavobacteriales bacterium]HQW87272.1 phage holin family protein [Flavobacteriales bacterium]
MNALIRLIITTIAVLICDLLLDGVTLGDLGETHGVLTALLTAAVLGLLNAFVRPLLILFTLPVTVVTLGLFLLVINAAVVLLAAELVPGFVVRNFWWALGFSLLLSVVESLLNTLDRGPRRERAE